MTKVIVNNCEFSFSDSDVVNKGGFIPRGEYNPHNVRPWLLHDHGFTLAVVFAGSLQDAIDEAVDAGKLNRYQVVDWKDYGDTYDEACEVLSSLGSAGELFDVEALGYVEFTNPAFSFAALANADADAEFHPKSHHLGC